MHWFKIHINILGLYIKYIFIHTAILHTERSLKQCNFAVANDLGTLCTQIYPPSLTEEGSIRVTVGWRGKTVGLKMTLSFLMTFIGH